MTSFLPTPRLNAASMLALWILGVHISSIVVGAPLNVSDGAENNATGDSSGSNGTFFNSNGTSIMPGCTAPSLDEIDLVLVLYVIAPVMTLIGLVLDIPGSFTVVTLLVRSLPNRVTVYMCAMAVLDSITLCLALFTMVRFENHFLYQVTLTFQAFSNWILTAICMVRYDNFRIPALFPKSRIFNWKIDGPSVVIVVFMSIVFLTGLLRLGFKNKSSAQLVEAGFEFLLVIMLVSLVILSLLGAGSLKQNLRSRKLIMSAETSRRSITLETQLFRMAVVMIICFVAFSSLFLAVHIIIAFSSTSSRQDTVACPSRNFASVFVLSLFWIISCVNPALHFYTYYSSAQRFRDKRSKTSVIELLRGGCLKPSVIELLRDGCLRQS